LPVALGRQRLQTAAITHFAEPRAMLELRPNCENCDCDLPASSVDALICSFECTFCRSCAESILALRCPNCGGELVKRPIRPAEKLERFPASSKRVLKA
jgi:hypothetical protein